MTLTQLQSLELKMFKQIANLCTQRGLTYYALGGTLLGAVRHKGFIPWDDDIDIALPRPDFDEFISVACDALTSPLVVRTYHDVSSDNEVAPNLCQIHDLSTFVMLDYGQQKFRTHVWVDVFPLDAMPTNRIMRSIQKYRILYHRMKIQFSMFELNAHQYRPNRPLHERMLMQFRQKTKFGASWDTEEMYDELVKCLKSFNYEDEAFCVNAMGAYKFREMFPKEWLGNPIMLPFEDTEMSCPSNYHAVLSQLYGDYMQLPPDDKKHDQHKMTIVSLGSEEALK